MTWRRWQGRMQKLSLRGANEAKATDKWSEMLTFVALAMQENELIALVRNPKVTKDRIVRLILEVSKGLLDKEGENFVKLLAQNDRLLLAPTNCNFIRRI